MREIAKIVFYIAAFFLLIVNANAQIPTLTFLNNSNLYDGLENNTLNLNVNIAFEQNPVHVFEGQSDIDNADWEIEYRASNTTGFLLRIVVNDQAGINGDKIHWVDCVNTVATSQICGGEACGGKDFNEFANFTVIFNSTSNNAKINVGTASLLVSICTNATEVGSVRFFPSALYVGTGYIVKNNLLTADNRPPRLIGTIYNITTLEETSAIINISGNFTDLDGQNLTFGFDSSNIENITISINSTTGIANLTPNTNFFGIRYVKFFANDSMNITFSNNVTINVTNVNDAPSALDIMLNNTDFLNRTNGSLIAAWAFNDADSDLPQDNETKWYRNGTEAVNLANLSSISRENTTRDEAWIFSISAFDGTSWSAWANSSQITIRNSAPFFSPELQNLPSEKLDRLFYDINYTELDNDSIAFYLNTTEFSISNEGMISHIFSSIGNRTINITMGDTSLNNSQTILIEIIDTSPPKITSISTSISGSSTVDVALSATTDENAVCRYSTSDINYSEMQSMSSTSSTSHLNSISYSSDSSGMYYVRCNDTLGLVMNFSNSTSFSADVQAQAQSAPALPSGDSGGWQCRYKWECSDWSECIEGKQKRDCNIVKTVPFYSETKCGYMEDIETEKECGSAIEKEEVQESSASLESNNIESSVNQASKSQTPTGGAILNVERSQKSAFGIASLALLVSSILLYAKFSHPRLFRKSQLSEEEMRKLKELIGKYEKL